MTRWFQTARPAALLAVVLALVLPASGAGSSPGSHYGFGANTPGGNGKPVYHVTNRNDSGPGSLRDAVSQGNRHIVFDVAGTIHATDWIDVRGAFVTLDGLSAPSPGITLSGWGLRLRKADTHDVIIRDLRIRNAGDFGSGEGDGIQITQQAHNVLVDHVSIGDTADGSIDVTRGAHDVTIQWSIFHRKSTHNLLSVTSYGSTRVTYHHNLFIGGTDRNPQAAWHRGGVPPEIVADIRNNLIWDFGKYGTKVMWGGHANVVANYYYSSAQTDPRRFLKVRTDLGSRAYAAGNVSQNGVDVDGEGTEDAPFPAAAVPTTDACTAAHDVVAHAGPRPLDAHDRAFVSRIELDCLPDPGVSISRGGP